jgi:di/tricarboxylate transporter
VTATATKVEVVNGKHVVTAYRVTNTSEYQNGKTWVSTFIGTITELSLSPKLTNADFSLASRNLDGAAVYMQDEPQIRYEMKDGQPVKSIDENMVRAAEGHFFARNNQLSRLAFAALVVLAAALLVYVVSWLRQRRTVG